MAYKKQTAEIPVLIDGEITDTLSARGMNKSIGELWAYIIQHGGLKLEAMQAVGDTPNFVCQTLAVHETNPFRTPSDQMVALSAYKNPYQKNRNMGMADNLGIELTAEKYIEFTVFPGNNMISLYFDKLPNTNTKNQ